MSLASLRAVEKSVNDLSSALRNPPPHEALRL